MLRLAKLCAARGWDRLARLLLACARLIDPASPAPLHALLRLSARRGDRAGVIDACRRLLAVRPDDALALETLAVCELTGGNVAAARALLDDAHRRGALADLRLAADALIDPARVRSEGLYVAVLRDVEVETADWSILDGDKVYNLEAHNRALGNCPFVAGRTDPAHAHFLFRLPAPAGRIETPCINLGGDHNYCHWITRNMVKLALLEGTPWADLPYLVNADLREHQRQFLDLLGIPEARLIRLERPQLYRIGELVVPTNLTNHRKMRVGTDWLRRRLAHAMDPGPPCELLFVSRRDARVRRLLNEDALEAALAPLGFVTVVPGAMTVREQVRRFSRARVIVGAHGAAFGNLMFAPAGAKVLEINSGFKAHILDFPVLARCCDLELVTVVSDDYDFSRPEPYAADTDFRVDVDEVMSALRRLAPALAGA